MTLSSKNVARLVFYPCALLACLVLAAPTLALHALIANGSLPVVAGVLFELAALSAGGILFAPVMSYLRQRAAAVGLRHEARQLIARGQFIQADFCFEQSERAQWRMLAGMALLLGAQFGLSQTAHAQMRDIERAEPRRFPAGWPDAMSAVRPTLVSTPATTSPRHLALARALQVELQLNEHGVQRALRYLRQGYSLNEVRNLFAPVVRKS